MFQAKGDTLGWDMKTLKHLTKLQDTDLLYASFVSEVSPTTCVHTHVHVRTCTCTYMYIHVHMIDMYMYMYMYVKARKKSLKFPVLLLLECTFH